jgi:hypothetical protein
MKKERFRKFALALEGVEERPHMGRTAFRTTRKIFATVGDDDQVNLMIHPAEKRESLLESFPDAFSSLGGWTRLGYVAVDLGAVDDALLCELVTDAWRDALPVKKARKRSR